MKNKKIPMRSCCITREKLEKRELIRIVRQPDGTVIVDESGKVNGRGAYIKRDIAVLEQAEKSNMLERVLECKVDKSIYDEIRNIISK